MGNNFKIKFDGELHQIDANTLINNLIHTSTIIQEINSHLNAGKNIEIKVKALEKGSFLINLELIEVLNDFSDLLTKENLYLAGSILSSLVNLIALRKFLRGNKIKEKKEISKSNFEITNENGDVLIIENLTLNIYENRPLVREALGHSFQTLENDHSIKGYEITDYNEKPLVSVSREEFQLLSRESDEIKDDERIITEAVKLSIVRISFDQSLRNDFIYLGNKISAKIKDPNFQKKIDKGESFSKGDILEAELEIRQLLDETVNTYINKSYSVIKITDHIPRAEQKKLNFDEE